MARSVVCIAGTDGADGDEVGRIVARELGFRLINQEVVVHAARIGRVEPRDVAGVEQRRSLLARLFERTLPRLLSPLEWMPSACS